MKIVARLEVPAHPGQVPRLPAPPAATAWAAHRGQIAVGTNDGVLQVLDVESGNVTSRHQTEGSVRVVVLRDRHLVAAVGDHVEVWDRETGAHTVHAPHSDIVNWIAVDGERGLVASVDVQQTGVRVTDLAGAPRYEIGRIAGARGPAIEPPPPTHPAALAVARAIADFERVQERLSKHGASDTEPDQVFQELVAAAWRGENPELPGEGWMLYTEASKPLVALDAAAAAVIAAIRAGRDHRAEVRPVLDRVIWRVDLDASAVDVSSGVVAWLPDGRLLVQHADTVGLWRDGQRVQDLTGELAGVTADTVIVRTSWPVLERHTLGTEAPIETASVRGVVLTHAEDVVIADPTGIWRWPSNGAPVRLGGGLARIGTPTALAAGMLFGFRDGGLNGVVLDRLAVDDERCGLPVHAVGVGGDEVLLSRGTFGEGRVEHWDLRTGEITLLPAPSEETWFTELGFAPGFLWASGGSTRLWTRADREPYPQGAEVVNARRLAALDDKTVLDLQTGVVSKRPGRCPAHFQTDPTGRLVVWHAAKTWAADLATGKLLAKTGTTVEQCQTVPRTDGTLLSITPEGIEVLDLRTVTSVATWPFPGLSYATVRWAADGRLVVIFDDGRVGCWAGGAEMEVVRPADGASVVRVEPGDGIVAVAIQDIDAGHGRIEVWALDGSGKQVDRRTSFEATVAVDGRRVAIGDADGTVVVLDV